jgi:dephospho-CoA kinase
VLHKPVLYAFDILSAEEYNGDRINYKSTSVEEFTFAPMSNLPEKYIIGLTGNIATGKSLVRGMLEHLGAYGIDADELAHRTISHGAAGYQLVLREFGKGILLENQEIDRNRLGKIVFQDPDALRNLESIIHPLVGKAIREEIRKSAADRIVIEAIKLIESGLVDMCDSLWVTTSNQQVQLERLKSDRSMAENDARIRILAQPAQEEKISRADVVIINNGSVEEVWDQVVEGWQSITPEENIRVEYPEAETWPKQ